MKALHILTLLASVAAASVLPRVPGYVPKGYCCFSLHDASTGTKIRQDDNGLLYLGGTNPEGWYCIDLPSKKNILIDHKYNACFRSPSHEIKCLDPIPSSQKWTLVKHDGDVRRVAIDGQETYKACPDGAGRESIWGTGRSECRSMNIEARGLKGTC